MPWQRYTRRPDSINHEYLQLSVYANGSGRIMKAARQRWFDGGDTEIAIYYDREKPAVAFDPEPDEEDRHVLRLGPDGNVSIKPVLRDAGVDVAAIEETHHLPLEEDNETGYVVVDLSELPRREEVTIVVDDGEDQEADEGEKTAEDDADEDDADEEVLDHTDPEHLRRAYEAADGVVKQAAERFDVGYRTVYDRMVDQGVHEPQEYDTTDVDASEDVAQDDGDQAVAIEEANGDLDLSTYGTSGELLTPEMVVDALADSQTVHQAVRDLGLGDREGEHLLRELGVYEELTNGRAKIERPEAETIVREAVGDA